MSHIKQVLIFRKDINCRRGKWMAQAAHASMKVILDMMVKGLSTMDSYMDVRTLNLSDRPDVASWLDGSFTKICVSVNSEEELDAIYDEAIIAGLNCAMIIDSGKTEFHGIPTKTVVAIGPNKSEDIDKITGHLKLL